jgi:ribosome-associated toxin RatA of RatAB toxin-antitoxin module
MITNMLYHGRRRGVFFLLFFLSFHLAADVDRGIFPNTDFKKIFNKPAIISSDVFSIREGDNSQWITMLADTHVTTAIPLAKLRYIITDYENYPRYFKRNTSSRIAAVTEEGTCQDVRVTVGLMGMSFSCRYTVLLKELVNTPAKFVLEFTHVSDDGNTRDVNGQWHFESVFVDGRPGTYVRYISSSTSLRKFFLQKTAMSLFGGAEFTGMIDQLLEAAAKLTGV